MSRSVLVTGATGGIGRATVERLLSRGWTVLATGRSDDDLATLKAMGCTPIRLELTDEGSIEAAAAAVKDGGGVDAIVLNAGVGVFGAVEDLSAEGWRHQFQVNLLGPVALLRPLLADLRARKGRIVFVSSQSGLLGLPLMSAYCSSKFAVEALADGLRMELAPFGTRVSVIEPGPVPSNFQDRTMRLRDHFAQRSGPYDEAYDELERRVRMRFGRISPLRVAKAISRALESRRPRARYPVGRLSYIGLRLIYWVPTRVRDRLIRWGLGA